jgi:hypothetical protein
LSDDTGAPTIISLKASNWVDRGEPPGYTLRRFLGALFHRDINSDAQWLGQHADTVLAMVAADATEVHVAGYLRSVARQLGYPEGEPAGVRMTANALWHAGKAALVRDFAERVLRGEVPPNEPTDQPLSRWLAAKLLSPSELAAYEAEARKNNDED